MVGRLSTRLGGQGLTHSPVLERPVTAHVERFAAMGTRVELHLFGAVEPDAILTARRAIEAVDDALTIHRPSATTALNEALMAGRVAAIDDPLLFEALSAVGEAHAATGGLFDPAADRSRSGGWDAVEFDAARARLSASRPLDFGGFGKGFALDRAAAVLRAAGVVSACLSAGESSILVIGEHPLGGGWPFAIPDPLRAGRYLAEVELCDEALSISATVGAGTQAPGRAATIRPGDGVAITAPRCAVAVDRSAAWAEVMSTALIVADDDAARGLPGERNRVFDLDRNAEILPRQGEVAAKLTEGEDTTTEDIASLPLRPAGAAHLPLAGEDWEAPETHPSPEVCV